MQLVMSPVSTGVRVTRASSALRGVAPSRLHRVNVVARVAAKSKKSTPPALPFEFKLGFTKSNELFVGRMAMTGFAAALIGELLTGKGILGQLGYETGLPTFEIDYFIGFLIAFNLVAALLPTSGTFVPEEQELLKATPKGALQDARITLLNPKEFFGVKRFGFTKENELFVGRVAQLGFVAAILGELSTGLGPLAQFDIETGIPLQDTEFGLAVFIGFFLLAAINEGSGKFVDE